MFGHAVFAGNAHPLPMKCSHLLVSKKSGRYTVVIKAPERICHIYVMIFNHKTKLRWKLLSCRHLKNAFNLQMSPAIANPLCPLLLPLSAPWSSWSVSYEIYRSQRLFPAIFCFFRFKYTNDYRWSFQRKRLLSQGQWQKKNNKQWNSEDQIMHLCRNLLQTTVLTLSF